MMIWARQKQAHVYKGVYGSAATYDELLDAMNQELFAELREDYANLALHKFFAAKADVAQGFLLARILFLERGGPDEAGFRSLRVHRRFLGARRMSSETAESLYGGLRDFLVAAGVDPKHGLLWVADGNRANVALFPKQRFFGSLFRQIAGFLHLCKKRKSGFCHPGKNRKSGFCPLAKNENLDFCP